MKMSSKRGIFFRGPVGVIAIFSTIPPKGYFKISMPPRNQNPRTKELRYFYAQH
jgi:hypothetical protein